MNEKHRFIDSENIVIEDSGIRNHIVIAKNVLEKTGKNTMIKNAKEHQGGYFSGKNN